jgi:4,5-DOPA dioxygenase extradiol
MKRRTLLAGGLGLMSMALSGKVLASIKESLPKTAVMPALFIGHGSPMNAIELNRYSMGWKTLRSKLPKPKAILCVSAHWLTQGSFVSSALKPETIHDFGGFPQALFDKQYPAPGSPETASRVIELTKAGKKAHHVLGDEGRGLDHGTWSVLAQMYPEADIPVLQLSINYNQPMHYHYQLAQQLSELRNHGVLVIGSGNIVHNLRRLQRVDQGYDWAVMFDEVIKDRMLAGDHQSIINYQQFGKVAQLSVPTPDHYIPLLYTLGLQRPNDEIRFINEWVTKGAISMRSVVLEQA